MVEFRNILDRLKNPTKLCFAGGGGGMRYMYNYYARFHTHIFQCCSKMHFNYTGVLLGPDIREK